MPRTEPDTSADEAAIDALERIQAFLAVILAERPGPLTALQRDLAQSAKTTAAEAEHRLLDERR